MEALIDCLKHYDSSVRESAVRALDKIIDPRALDPLINFLKDNDSNVKRAAIDSLVNIEDSSAIEPLLSEYFLLCL